MSQELVASLHDVRPLATMLRGVSFCSDATVMLSEAGLTVSVEEAKTLVARAYVPFSMFDEYKYNPPPQDLSSSQDADPEDEPSTTFEISLDTLLECLNIFGTGAASSSHMSFENRKRKKWKHDSDDSDEGRGRGREKRGRPPKGNATIDQFFSSSGEKKTSMRMTYAGVGNPLTLVLAEDAAGPTTTCEIQTMENGLQMELPFDNAHMVIKIILRSSWLADALSELDPSCDKLTFTGMPPSEALPGASNTAQKSPAKAILTLSAEGTFGSSQMDYPNDRDVLETFECAAKIRFTYLVSHITCASRALQSSLKTSLRIDDEGLLSLQFLMAAGGPQALVDFRCLPLQDNL
ncbi:Rad1-domain-containing protein [Ramaria rubella]|nr:Rad1-domain-containing protein [Ramaria rubella]